MDLTPYQDYAVYGLIAIGVLILVVMLARTVGSAVRGKRGSRLGVSEFYEIDKTRRLVLVRRDDVEHLVLIGGPQDVVIEQRIGLDEVTPFRREEPVSPPDFITEHKDEPRVTPIKPRAPRPAVFGDRAPNLRPVEREEPKFGDSGSDRSGEN